MLNASSNYYKSCREMSGLTQEAAAEYLHMSVRTVAAYETNERIPSDDIVDAMVGVYNTPLLAWRHLKQHSRLGKHLPDVEMPQSIGDVGFQTVLAEMDVSVAVGVIKRVLADGVVDESEWPELIQYRQTVANAANRLLSIKTYIDKALAEEGGGSGTNKAI